MYKSKTDVTLWNHCKIIYSQDMIWNKLKYHYSRIIKTINKILVKVMSNRVHLTDSILSMNAHMIYFQFFNVF